MDLAIIGSISMIGYDAILKSTGKTETRIKEKDMDMKTTKTKRLTTDVGELSRQMSARLTTIPAFRWPLAKNYAVKLLTAAYMAEVERRHRFYLENDDLRRNIDRVAEALTLMGNPILGLVMCGQCGRGKSTMLYAIRTATNYLEDKGYFVQHRSYGEYNPDVTVHIATCVALTMMKDSEYLKYVDYPIIGLDDLGTEPREVMSYGNIRTPIETLLEYRYSKGLTTFITTNLEPGKIESIYGKRISDRFRETMEPIPFDNGSFR